MPEIVEVKLYADFIKKKINNNKLLNIKIVQGRYKNHGPFKNYKKLLYNLPTKILNINTKGKFMYWNINEKEELYIGFSLGLFGGWLFKKKNQDKYQHENFYGSIDKSYLENAIKHINVEFEFENGYLYFYDQLSFGTIKIYNLIELNNKIKKFGCDIMDLNTTLEIFVNKIKSKSNLKKLIGIVLLNQKIIAGIGNYLRADLLWLCRISPFRKVNKLTDNEFKDLYDNIRLLTWSSYNYEEGIRLNIINKKNNLKNLISYVDYKNSFLIYNKENDIYGNTVIKEQLYEGNQIRYIYWVPKLQK